MTAEDNVKIEEDVDALRVSYGSLRQFTASILECAGLPEDDARRVAALMALADLRGADGHGVFRLSQYVRRVEAKGINPRPRVRLAASHGATALVDGDNGMGHLAVSRASEAAIAAATEFGVSWVGVRNGNHAGPGSLYAMMPLEQGMIGMYFAVGSANHMAPWGGSERLLSTNPIAFAAPTVQHPPVVLDMATSVVSYGTIKRRSNEGQNLPEGWMIDSKGEALRDSARAEEGLLLPVGGYKGYGLSLMVTLLAGVLNSTAVGRALVDFNHDDITPANTGQAVVAVDPARFAGSREAFKRRVDDLIAEIKGSATLPGVEQIRVPGERSAAIAREREALGIPINHDLRSDLDALASRVGVQPLPGDGG